MATCPCRGNSCEQVVPFLQPELQPEADLSSVRYALVTSTGSRTNQKANVIARLKLASKFRPEPQPRHFG